MAQKEFIEKATSIYGDKFSYEKVNFTNLKTKVLIHCLKKDKFGIEHGYFWIEPSAFLNQRQSCPRCSNRFKYTPTEFLKAARLVHHNVYNYDLSNYKNGSSYINIICPKHGVFKQKARFHLMGEGCPECGRCNRKRISQDEFIKKAKEVHGDKYDYSKVNYVNNHTKVCIICSEHGEFWQTPHKHLKGEGCPKCKESSLERIVRLNLEKNQIIYIQEYTPPFFKRKRYDFCIPDKKILIECQGEQHYYPVAFGDLDANKTKQRFQNIVKSDKEKRDQAIKNGYKILYFTKDKLKKYNEIVNIDDLIDIINNS